MVKHLIVACHVVAFTGLGHAAPAEASKPPRTDLRDCVTATRSDAQVYTAELVGGAKVEISTSPDGSPSAIRITTAQGESTVTHVDDLPALQAQALQEDGAPDGTTAAMDARSRARSGSIRAATHQFRTMIRTYCKRMQQQAGADLKPGARTDPDPGTDWLLWPDLLEDRSSWFEEARYQVEDTFYTGMNDWSNDIGSWIDSLKEKQRVLPSCHAVREDCRSTCDRVGTYAGGVVCGGLAAVAAALSAGVGVSVGVYCGGRVLLKMEECRFNCVVPGVSCSN